MKPLVSIVTPSIPERSRYLEELVASVEAQTFRGFEHLTWIDEEREGCARVVNRLAERAEGEWLLIVADDDLILPRCLEVMLEFGDDADVVYSPPLVWGNDSRHFFGEPPYIPSFGLVYMDLWREIGGYREDAIREEDRKFWIEAMRLGAKFVKCNYPTWVYRFHGGNKSYANGVAS